MNKKEFMSLIEEFPDDADVFVFNPWSEDFEPVIDVEPTYENGRDFTINFR